MQSLLAEGFVVEDQCTFTFLPSAVLLEGTIVCIGGVTIDVKKDDESAYMRKRVSASLLPRTMWAWLFTQNFPRARKRLVCFAFAGSPHPR
jgi:hypothetical protein